jgi:hypothetical protein
LEDLNIKADRLITHSMVTNTWKTYKTAVDSINEFRHIYALSNSWPIPLDEINIDYPSVAHGLRHFSTQEIKILNLALESGEIS